jgi:hypothetical protein
MSNSELADSLVEVRKAFRIAVAYQRRVNELFYEVHKIVGGSGFNSVRWQPNYYHAPDSANKPQFSPDKWAWDMFPGYCLSAEWRTEGPPFRRVWVGLDTDTAFFKAKKDANGGQPDPVAFAPADSPDSRSELWVGLYTSDKPIDWTSLWKEKLSKEWTQAIDKDHPWTFDSNKITGTYRCFCVPLDSLDSLDAIQTRLLDPIQSWA